MWRSIASTLASVAILLLAHGMLGTLLPLRWMKSGMDSTTISAIAAALYLGILVGGVYGLRVGGGRTRLRGIVFGATLCGSTLLFLSPAPAVLLGAARTAGGFAFAGMNVLIESRLNAGAPPRRRARVLSAYMMAFYLAQATGSALVDGRGPGGAWLVIAAGLWPIGVAADRLGPARAAPWAHGAVALLSLAPIAARGLGDSTVLAASVLFGAVAFSLYPIASATINARVGGPERIAANALLVVVSGLGGCAGPLFAAVASRRFGSDALFVTTASSGAMIAGVQVYARWRWSRSRA